MAESKHNDVILGASGKFGKMFVFRQKGDKTLLTRAPKERTGEASEKVKAVNTRFQHAVIYGKSVLADLNVKAEYANMATNGKSAYNVAIADFFNAPDIHEVDISEYTGRVGSKIRISVEDDFKVTTVRVKISNPDGSVVEEGEAQHAGSGPDWFYVATAENENLEQDRILITVTDRPANEITKEHILN